eukprot:CAMPEP_0184479376 /NCGR_PEP_ID=MMETSP0113_2-20130426/1129_1 /TAXON_ID=91329 /ORGANISM="Norrisiella sphaerica, Strain BC52" /LENGTH=316 /DNA_ID=CAMNT_0026857449 /DNA_START=338 /DNA_END=1288 /DNA_ORIENTATION=-
MENKRLYTRFKSILVEKQMDNVLKRGTPIDFSVHRRKEQERIHQDNQRLCTNLNKCRTTIPIRKYIKEHTEKLNQHESRRCLKSQIVDIKPDMQTMFKRSYSQLKKNKQLFQGTASSRPTSAFPRLRSVPMESKSTALRVNKDGSVTRNTLELDGESFAVFATMRNNKERNERELFMTLKQLRTKRIFKIVIPKADLKTCFRSFPRLLQEESFPDLAGFVMEFIHFKAGGVVLNLGPIARLGEKMERECSRKSQQRISRPRTQDPKSKGPIAAPDNLQFPDLLRKTSVEEFKIQFGTRHNSLSAAPYSTREPEVKH